MVNSADKTDTKIKVFMAAAELFAAHGYYHVSVKEICDAAGVSKPVLYYYFKDKEDLLYKLVNEMHARQYELFNEYVMSKDSFLEKINGLYNLYLNFAQKYPYLIKLSTLVHFSPLPGKIKKMSHNTSLKIHQYIISVFEEGKKENIIRQDADSEMLVYSLLGPVGIIVTKSVLGHSKIPIETDLKKYFDLWTSQFLSKKVKPE